LGVVFSVSGFGGVTALCSVGILSTRRLFPHFIFEKYVCEKWCYTNTDKKSKN
jgi:hypothetical protein